MSTVEKKRGTLPYTGKHIVRTKIADTIHDYGCAIIPNSVSVDGKIVGFEDITNGMEVVFVGGLKERLHEGNERTSGDHLAYYPDHYNVSVLEGLDKTNEAEQSKVEGVVWKAGVSVFIDHTLEPGNSYKHPSAHAGFSAIVIEKK